MRKSIPIALFLATLCAYAPAWSQNVSLEIEPSLTIGPAGGTVNIPVLLSTVDPVFAAQFTIDYDETVAVYQSTALGSDLNPAFFTTLVNPNPPVGTASPETNRSVLVQVFGGGAQGQVTGSDIEIAIITFALRAGVCNNSPLTFDPNCSPHTQVVVGSDLVCSPQLALKSGSLATSCATDVAPLHWGAFKRLYRE